MDMGMGMTASIAERLSAQTARAQGAVPCARPGCKGQATTTDTRRDRFPLFPSAILRLKKCGKCGFQWSTIEAPLEAFMGAAAIDDGKTKDQIAKAADEAAQRTAVKVATTVQEHLGKLSIAMEAIVKASGDSARYALPGEAAPPKTAKRLIGRPPKVRPGERDRGTAKAGGKERNLVGDNPALIETLPPAIQKEARELRATLEKCGTRGNGSRDISKATQEEIKVYVDMADSLDVDRKVSCPAIGIHPSLYYNWKRGRG